MNGPILTPISLWKGFHADLPLESRTLSSVRQDGLLVEEVRFSGRQTAVDRVNAYGVLFRPLKEEAVPAVLFLGQNRRTAEFSLVRYIALRGYAVLYLDYFGESEWENYTLYPQDVSYANYARAGRTLLHADEGADKTAWYEWTALAAYAEKYLRSLPFVRKVGALGIREGGEILWKLMTLTKLDCGVCIDSAGWLAYRGIDKFGGESVPEMDEEKRMFLAGLDSQTYAPFVQCPVLMLVATSDAFLDADRAYDTYLRINQNVFSTIDVCVGYRGFVDDRSGKDVDMFFDKFLKDRAMFLAKPLTISTGEKEGKFCLLVGTDRQGEIASERVYFSDDAIDAGHREWLFCPKASEEEGKKIYFASPCRAAKTVFAFARVQYSSGFSVASRIIMRKLEKDYENTIDKSAILYDGRTMGIGFFVPAEDREIPFSDLSKGIQGMPYIKEGYGKIAGITCENGLKTYRIARARYAPDERSMLHFSLYGEGELSFTVSVKREGKIFRYAEYMEADRKWRNKVLSARDFKTEDGVALRSFKGGESLSFTEAEQRPFIIDNVLWI